MENQEILTVSQLTSAIKGHLEAKFSFVTVKGEISNLKRQASGHTYFTLKDQGAQISAVLFRGNSQGLERLPKEGDEIIATGELSVYPPRGNYQLILRKLQFAGTGELLIKLHEIKQKLAQAGYFDKERKKRLPSFPKRIGVITSPTGAVIQDILNILSRRLSNFELILNPVRVQGSEAAAEIAGAINQFNRHGLADVLIVGRGGGSLEDLWPFNEIIVAEALYNSKIPVISAVGHETDFSICDFVADVRAPTPSAAAEIVSAESAAQHDFLKQCRTQLNRQLTLLIEAHRQKLYGIENHPLFKSAEHLLSKYWQMSDEISASLDRLLIQSVENKQLRLEMASRQLLSLNPKTQVQTLKQKLTQATRSIDVSITTILDRYKERLPQTVRHLQSIDPKNLLKKGYAIPFREKESSVILSAASVEPGERFELMLHDGTIKSEVIEKKHE